jgi:hypothetical protein
MNMTTKKCVACTKRPSDSVDEPGIPPLCRSCWQRQGRRITEGANVVCISGDSCNGTVERFEDGGTLAVVRTSDGGEAWVPVIELVRTIG